jgi:hypothetical protein
MGSNPAFHKLGRPRKVQVQVLEKVGHLVPHEAPSKTAEMVALWIEQELNEWKVREWDVTRRWREMSREKKEEMTEKFMRSLRSRVEKKSKSRL